MIINEINNNLNFFPLYFLKVRNEGKQWIRFCVLFQILFISFKRRFVDSINTTDEVVDRSREVCYNKICNCILNPLTLIELYLCVTLHGTLLISRLLAYLISLSEGMMILKVLFFSKRIMVGCVTISFFIVFLELINCNLLLQFQIFLTQLVFLLHFCWNLW